MAGWRGSLDYVEANLNYFIPPPIPTTTPNSDAAASRAAFYVYSPSEEERALSPEIARHRVRIHNARRLEHLSLEEQGVALARFDEADSARTVAAAVSVALAGASRSTMSSHL
jgi:hypothetical protein